MAEVEPVRFGVMGCASIAWRRVLPTITALTGTELVAIASRDQGKARRFAERFGGRPVDGYAGLLESEEVEAVYIPLPAALHAPWVEATLKSGKHVLAEKPLTTDGSSTRALAELAQQRGLILNENVMFLNHHQHHEVKRLVRDGAIGTVHAFDATFAIPELPPNDIRYQAKLGGGALLDVGPYPVRSALYFLGADLKVTEAALTSSERHEVDTGGTARLRTPDGVQARLSFSLAHTYQTWYRLTGSEGTITVNRAFTPPADHVPEVELERDGATREVRLACDDQVANAIRSFAVAVRTGPLPTPHESIRQAFLLDDIRLNALPPRDPSIDSDG